MRKPKKLNRRAVIAERMTNLRKARETASALLWMKAVIETNQRRGISLGC